MLMEDTWLRVSYCGGCPTDLGFVPEVLAMRKYIVITLICIAIPITALPDEYKPPPQVLMDPVGSFYKGKAIRAALDAQEQDAELRGLQIDAAKQERMRLRLRLRLLDERTRQEIEQRKRADRNEQERLLLQREEEQRLRATAFQAEKNTDSFGVDPVLVNTLDQLSKLGELKKEGVLTNEEFEKLKKEILDSHTSPTGAFK